MSTETKPQDTKVNVDGKVNSGHKKNDSRLDDERWNDIQEQLKSNPKATKCPYCDHEDITYVERKMNVVSAITCYCCGCCWGLYSLFKKKDFTCWDADHRCHNCEKEIANYRSC